MTQAPLKLSLVAAIAAALWAQDVHACDVGPFALEFGSGSAQLSESAKGLLDYERSMLGLGGRNLIRVAFHDVSADERVEERELRTRRTEAILDYLRASGLQQSQIEIVATAGAAPRIRESRQLDSRVTVELVGGCGD